MKTISSYRDTDKLMLGVFNCLKRDFAAIVPGVADELEFLNPKQFREQEHPTYWLSPHMYFKMRYQLETLFKRYRFADDLYTEVELEDRTFAKFLETQQRIAVKRDVTYRAFLVLQRARQIVKRILGCYDESEHFEACKFGTKADVGCPASSAYLDIKVQKALITGSFAHREWFQKDYLCTDELLSTILDQRSIPFSEEFSEDPIRGCTDALNLVPVPKTFKILRSIMPNTRIGCFYTSGLGKVIEHRLVNEGLDIRKLQRVHRKLAQRYSKTRTHVTADLSAASDSFTWELICRLLPRKWLRLIDKGRITTVKIRGKNYRLESFMTMGIGFTFPLQTLLFYSIIKATMELSNVHGRVSVYGDDLIYPTKVHSFVSQIFSDIGFVLNDDKTFVHQDFRESCGGDYYCGIDVRPYQPEGQHDLLAPKPYAVLVYKTINGLLQRWTPYEIPSTLNYLLTEVATSIGCIHQVPPSFPDYSGVKVLIPNWKLPWYQPWVKVTRDGNQSYRFAFLGITSRDRIVDSQYAYLWERLRSAAVNEPIADPFGERDPFAYLMHPNKGSLLEAVLYEAPVEVIRWVKCKHQPKNYRSKITGKRLIKREAVVARKQDPGRILHQSGVLPAWI